MGLALPTLYHLSVSKWPLSTVWGIRQGLSVLSAAETWLPFYGSSFLHNKSLVYPLEISPQKGGLVPFSSVP